MFSDRCSTFYAFSNRIHSNRSVQWMWQCDFCFFLFILNIWVLYHRYVDSPAQWLPYECKCVKCVFVWCVDWLRPIRRTQLEFWLERKRRKQNGKKLRKKTGNYEWIENQTVKTIDNEQHFNDLEWICVCVFVCVSLSLFAAVWPLSLFNLLSIDLMSTITNYKFQLYG